MPAHEQRVATMNILADYIAYEDTDYETLDYILEEDADEVMASLSRQEAALVDFLKSTFISLPFPRV